MIKYDHITIPCNKSVLHTTAIVIDDEPDVRDVFSDCLSMYDVKVLGIGKNGKEAVELYKKFQPEIVFLDVLMPEFDGLYGLEKIREYDPESKVIVVTASIDTVTRKELVERNASAVIWKPFDMKKVLQIIEQVKNSTSLNQSQSNELKVRFKFKDQTKGYRAILTWEQYLHLKEIPAIEFCEIVETLGSEIPLEIEVNLKKRLREALKNDKSHVQSLSYD